MALGTGGGFSAPGESLFLSDHQELICDSSMGWGVLGINRAAHPAGETGMRLRIKDKVYDKGLGHHAPGSIVIELDGSYSAFEAEVGTQWVNGKDGSVVFQVFVDDEKRFDSGKMLPTDEAKPVHVSLDGAQELRLVLTDAGDGINCDLGNWANARLIQADSKKGTPVRQIVDIGQFARVVTFDPDRMDGARASRVQAFHPDDVYLETDIAPKSGAYAVPTYKDGRGCIGLQWIERRKLKTLEIELAGKDPVPSTDGAQVQYWAGITRWQGEWKPLKGTIAQDGRVWQFAPDASEADALAHGTMKVRWIFAKSERPIEMRRLSAFSGSRWGSTDISLQLKQPIPGAHADIELYNGEIVGDKGSTTHAKWDLASPLRLSVRYSKPSDWKSDATMIRFRLPGQSFSIAMDDLLSNECVYVQPSGVFAVKEPAAVTLAEYEQKIARKKSILEMVRHMPDQTFASAMDHIYNTDQDTAPTMLSLSCSNDKFVLHHGRQMLLSLPNELKWQTYPDGTIRRPLPGKYVTFEPFEFRSELGSENRKIVGRSLDGGSWFPIPVTTTQDGGITYTQRTYVAPYGKDDKSGTDRSLCVVETTARKADASSEKASMRLIFQEDAEKSVPATAERVSDNRMIVRSGDKLMAVVDAIVPSDWHIDVKDGVCTISGDMAAGGEGSCLVYMPAWTMKPEEHAAIRSDAGLLLAIEAHWRDVMSKVMQIEIPDPAFKNIILASQVHCLMASRTAADGKSIEPWVSSMWYQALESESNSIVRGMGLLGHTDYARKSLDHFIGMYSPEGFLTTGYTLMGTGWHLTTLGEFYALTHDSEWMRSIAPKVASLCKWIAAQREKTKKLDAHGKSFPESGLLPPGVMADWEPFAYYFCLNGHFHAGLHEAATALEAVKYPGAEGMVEAADEFRRDILKAYDWAQSMSPVLPLRDGTWVPAYPSQVYVFGPTANAYPGEGWAWCYDVELGGHQLVPQQVLDPNSRQTEWMMRHLEDAQYSVEGWCKFRDEVKDDWFNIGGFSKVQPYYSRNAEIYAMADDVKPFIRSYFNTVPCLLDREDLSFWEHPQGKGAWNKTHETGYFLQQSRFMMVMEHGDELRLAPLVTNNWMKDGMVVAAKNAPTRFGKVSFRITSHAAQGFIEAQIEPPTRNTPKTIAIRLRHPDGKPIRSVEVNGQPHTDFDPEREIVRLTPGKGTVTVKAVYGE